MRHAFSGSAARRGAMITELVPLVLRRLDDSLITTSAVPRVNISSTFAAAKVWRDWLGTNWLGSLLGRLTSTT